MQRFVCEKGDVERNIFHPYETAEKSLDSIETVKYMTVLSHFRPDLVLVKLENSRSQVEGTDLFTYIFNNRLYVRVLLEVWVLTQVRISHRDFLREHHSP